MISKKAILAWVFSAIVSVGMLAIPGRALAHDHDEDHDGEGWRGHDRGWHRGWDDNRGWNNYRGQNWGENEDEEEEEEHENGGYYQRPHGYGYQPYGYGYRQRYGYGFPRNGAGMVNPRHPGLIWACDSQGHHCHWARRYGYNGGYYGNNDGGYGNGYYGNQQMGGLGTLLGPLFGQPY